MIVYLKDIYLIIQWIFECYKFKKFIRQRNFKKKNNSKKKENSVKE